MLLSCAIAAAGCEERDSLRKATFFPPTYVLPQVNPPCEAPVLLSASLDLPPAAVVAGMPPMPGFLVSLRGKVFPKDN